MHKFTVATAALAVFCATGALAQTTDGATTPPATTTPPPADNGAMTPAPGATDNGAMTPGAATPAPGADTATTGDTASSRPADLSPVADGDLTADTLIGTTVYGPDDSTIGSISDLALTPDGKVDAVIVDVGGFLGIGAKPVAMAMDNLDFMKDSSNNMYLTTTFTKEALEAAPEYNKDEYAGSRDTMRLESGAAVQ